MSCIYINQPLKLESTVTVDGATPSSDVTAAAYEYWKPDNNSLTPDGEWTATITDATAGEIEYLILADIIDQAGVWRLQVNAEVGGLTYPACTDTITVKARGV